MINEEKKLRLMRDVLGESIEDEIRAIDGESYLSYGFSTLEDKLCDLQKNLPRIIDKVRLANEMCDVSERTIEGIGEGHMKVYDHRKSLPIYKGVLVDVLEYFYTRGIILPTYSSNSRMILEKINHDKYEFKESTMLTYISNTLNYCTDKGWLKKVGWGKYIADEIEKGLSEVLPEKY